VAVNRWLRELPTSGAPAPGTWAVYARILREWMAFCEEHGTSVFADREDLRAVLGAYAAYRAEGPEQARFAATTWNQHMSVLSSFYQWAVAEGHAVAVPFSYAASRAEARDFSCWIQLTAKQRLQTSRPRVARLSSRAAGAPNPVTGKPASGDGYAPSTVAHSVAAAESSRSPARPPSRLPPRSRPAGSAATSAPARTRPHGHGSRRPGRRPPAHTSAGTRPARGHTHRSSWAPAPGQSRSAAMSPPAHAGRSPATPSAPPCCSNRLPRPWLHRGNIITPADST